MHNQLTTSPLFGDPRLPARFWVKVRVLNNGCWEWAANRNRLGYAQFTVGSRTDDSRQAVFAHRFAYEGLIAPIPEGLECDHLCRNRACVYPSHVELVTHSQNILRGNHHQRDKTHCVHGHLFDEANTYIYGNWRYCRACRAEKARRRRRRIG